MFTVTRHPFSLLLIMLLPLCMQSVQAEEKSTDDNTYLQVARDQLSIAFDKYSEGDITAAKLNLKKASDWLYKAVTHSTDEKVKIEAEKLASEIDSFSVTLNHSSEQNDLVRFWHQATSLVIRESEQLIHSYINSSNDNTTLRHLLDAKMHFFLAEHDLFVSHELDDSLQELNDSLAYLEQAVAIAKPDLKTRINNMIRDIQALISLSKSSKESWKKNKLITSLNKAIINVTNAKSIATPPTKLRLQSIEEDIQQLKLELQKTSIKTRYDAIMSDFSRIIKNI